MPVRTALGYDVHRFGGTPPLIIGGVEIDPELGLQAHSDGDLAAHAITDALLGAAGLGDMGEWYPAIDPTFAQACSLDLLRDAHTKARSAGYHLQFVDLTLVAQSVRIGPHRGQITETIAQNLALPTAAVSVKATTTDGLGSIGRGEGMAALALVTVTTPSLEEEQNI